MSDQVSKKPEMLPADVVDCMDRAQLAALFEDAQRPKPACGKPMMPVDPDPCSEEEAAIMRLNFWDI